MASKYQNQNLKLRVHLQSLLLKPQYFALRNTGWLFKLSFSVGDSQPMILSTVLLVKKRAFGFVGFIQGVDYLQWFAHNKSMHRVWIINHLNYLRGKIQLTQIHRLVISTKHISFSLYKSTREASYKSKSSDENGVRISISQEKLSFPFFKFI